MRVECELAMASNDELYSTQVYKVVVKWTNETETVIYRRYSSFFDFVVSPLIIISPWSGKKLDIFSKNQ